MLGVECVRWGTQSPDQKQYSGELVSVYSVCLSLLKTSLYLSPSLSLSLSLSLPPSLLCSALLYSTLFHFLSLSLCLSLAPLLFFVIQPSPLNQGSRGVSIFISFGWLPLAPAGSFRIRGKLEKMDLSSSFVSFRFVSLLQHS